MRIADADMKDVWADYKKAPTDALRDVLLEKYLPLVRYVAERLSHSLPSFVEVDDLASMGIFGLFDSIDRFDPGMGVKFKTYAMNRIRGSILDELRSLDWVPRLVRIKANKIDKACAQLHRELRPVFEAAHKTVLMVTHDLGEAFRLGDRVSVMHEGEVVQTGTEEELLAAPENDFVAGFLAAHRGGA